MADWELWPGAAAWHLESTVSHVTNPGKGENSKFEVPFLLNVLLSHHHRVENLLSGTVVKLVTICLVIAYS